MVVNQGKLVWRAMDQWPIAYRFTDDRYNILPHDELASIRPLTHDSGKSLAEEHNLLDLTYQARTNRLSADWITEPIDEEDLESTREWLRRFRPEAVDDVYVELNLNIGFVAAVVAWPTLVQYFDDFWYSFEIMLVSDDSREWQVIFGPNDYIRWRRAAPLICR